MRDLDNVPSERGSGYKLGSLSGAHITRPTAIGRAGTVTR